MQAQEELLAGVAKKASRPWGESDPVELPIEVDEPEESMEEYDRSMSPLLFDKKNIPYDDRQIEVLNAKEDLGALVRILTSYFVE